MAPLTIDSLVRTTDQLLAMPRVVGEALRLLDDPDSAQADIAACLERDPALAALLLRLANSPAFATRQVDSLGRALNLLGRAAVRRLIIAGAVNRASTRLPKQNLLPLEAFWRHSAYCAVIARSMVESHNRELADTVFLGGLLHDLGLLVLFSQQPEAEQRAFLTSLSAPQTLSPEDAEAAELGFDHAELGGALAEYWGLPAILCAMLRFHHEPLAAPEHLRYPVAVIHLANTAAHLAELDSRDWRDAPPIVPEAWAIAQMTPEALLELVERAQHQVLAVEALNDPG